MLSSRTSSRATTAQDELIESEAQIQTDLSDERKGTDNLQQDPSVSHLEKWLNPNVSTPATLNGGEENLILPLEKNPDQDDKGDTATEFDQSDPFPEGGIKAWMAVFAGFWCLFFSFGLVNTFGVFEEYYLSTILQTKTSSQVSWIGSFQYGFIFFFGPLVGRLFDAGYLRSVRPIPFLSKI